ncbi:MAG: hypothetical protein HWE11_08990 [Gammaproteobacteria bacterium]|nr:hypothetical protein [Gammaproteobacteria bacterium]
METFSFNDNAEERFSLGCLSFLDDFDAGKLDSLYVENDNGEYGISVTRQFSFLELGFYVFKVSVYNKSDNNRMFYDLLKSDVRNTDILYGYGRFYSSKFSPASESKIKKSFLGGQTIKISKELPLWYEHPSNLESGAIKGLYPLNYWKASKLQGGPLAEILSKYKVEVTELDGQAVLIELDEEVLDKVEENESQLKSFVRGHLV